MNEQKLENNKFLNYITNTKPRDFEVKKLVKYWDKLYRISKWNNEYTLLRYKTAKGRHYSIKFKLNEDIAKSIINILKLREIRCYVFASASEFLQP